jgi:hypothetical protein
MFFAILGEQSQATADHDGKDHQPEFIDQPVREQRPYQRGAAGHEDGSPLPRFEGPHRRRNAFGYDGGIPAEFAESRRDHVFIFSANSPSRSGQAAENPSYVTRPSKRDSASSVSRSL